MITRTLGVEPKLDYAGGERGWVGDSPFIFLDTAKLKSFGWRQKLSIRDAMRIERNGDTVATIRKAMISPFRDKYKIELESGGELVVKGKIGDHNYKFERDGDKIAEVSKKWFKVRDTYGIEINPEEDDVLILAAAVCLEEMSSGVVD